ncbi:MAG: hypothetical protein ACYC2G_13555 [Gemmatimonadaceae bacterium]
MTARRVLLALALGALAGASAAPLGAQSLASRVGELIRFGDCDQALCLSTGPGPHGTHYIDAAASASAELLDFLTSSITASVDRLPISATSGGTTFRFVGGAPVRSTTSAGPIFAECQRSSDYPYLRSSESPYLRLILGRGSDEGRAYQPCLPLLA